MSAVEQATVWVDAEGAAQIAGVHPETIRDALRAGELHGSQRVKGGRWRVRPECVDVWIEGTVCSHQARTNITPLRRAS